MTGTSDIKAEALTTLKHCWSSHFKVGTVVCTELCLGRRLVQLGRVEFVQTVDGELEQLGRGCVLGNESDELLVLLLPDLSGLRQH